MGGDSTLIVVMGVFLAIVPAIPYAILHKKPIGIAWGIFIIPMLVISYFMNQRGTAHYQFEIAGIPILILATGTIISGLLFSRLKQSSAQHESLVFAVSFASALAVSYWGYSEAIAKYRFEESTSLTSRATSVSSPIRDREFFKKGIRMTREQLIGNFGPPDIANDQFMAYKGIRPENGKDAMCFFHMKQLDGVEQAVSLNC